LYAYANFTLGDDLKCGDYVTGIIKKCGTMKNDIRVILRMIGFKQGMSGGHWRGLRLLIPGAGNDETQLKRNGCKCVFPNLYKEMCMGSTNNNFNKCKQNKTKDSCDKISDCVWKKPIDCEDETDPCSYSYHGGGIQCEDCCSLLSQDQDSEVIKLCQDIHINLFNKFPGRHPTISSLAKTTNTADINDFNREMGIKIPTI
jgi:hypothetical protein